MQVRELKKRQARDRDKEVKRREKQLEKERGEREAAAMMQAEQQAYELQVWGSAEGLGLPALRVLGRPGSGCPPRELDGRGSERSWGTGSAWSILAAGQHWAGAMHLAAKDCREWGPREQSHAVAEALLRAQTLARGLAGGGAGAKDRGARSVLEPPARHQRRRDARAGRPLLGRCALPIMCAPRPQQALAHLYVRVCSWPRRGRLVVRGCTAHARSMCSAGAHGTGGACTPAVCSALALPPPRAKPLKPNAPSTCAPLADPMQNPGLKSKESSMMDLVRMAERREAACKQEMSNLMDRRSHMLEARAATAAAVAAADAAAAAQAAAGVEASAQGRADAEAEDVKGGCSGDEAEAAAAKLVAAEQKIAASEVGRCRLAGTPAARRCSALLLPFPHAAPPCRSRALFAAAGQQSSSPHRLPPSHFSPPTRRRRSCGCAAFASQPSRACVRCCTRSPSCLERRPFLPSRLLPAPARTAPRRQAARSRRRLLLAGLVHKGQRQCGLVRRQAAAWAAHESCSGAARLRAGGRSSGRASMLQGPTRPPGAGGVAVATTWG
jgi:hypothetical protein